MTKPALPLCSVDGCIDDAGVIIDGALLCPHHGHEMLERRRASHRADGKRKQQ
jgi:hypothetical protein